MILEVKNGSFGYKKDELILKNISFKAEPHDLIAILGPNGAGKTTLLRCTLGFLKWQSGESTLDNENIRNINIRKMWQHVAYVPQAKNFNSSSTVIHAVLLGRNSRMKLFSEPSKDDISFAEKILEKLKLTYLKDKKCNEISGGELQMVLIARALASEPEIVIFDEPESNLDFRNQLIVLNVMSELAESGMTCIFNTHFPSNALSRANKSLLLSKDGTCIFGETADVVTEENIEKTFGVKTVIGDLETDENVYKGILPVKLSDGEETVQDNENRIAVISILTRDPEISEKINISLHGYSEYIVGRMGMPYRDNGKVYIINVVMNAPKKVISSAAMKLGAINHVSVKAVFAEQPE